MKELRVCVYDAGAGARVGSAIESSVYDLNLCCAQQMANEKHSLESYRLANAMVPSQLEAFLTGGRATLSAARTALEFVLKEGSGQGPADEKLLHDARDVQLRAPILPTSKIVCLALAYKSHADVGGKTPYGNPEWFIKMSQTVVGPEESTEAKTPQGSSSWGQW